MATGNALADQCANLAADDAQLDETIARDVASAVTLAVLGGPASARCKTRRLHEEANPDVEALAEEGSEQGGRLCDPASQAGTKRAARAQRLEALIRASEHRPLLLGKWRCTRCNSTATRATGEA